MNIKCQGAYIYISTNKIIIYSGRWDVVLMNMYLADIFGISLEINIYIVLCIIKPDSCQKHFSQYI